jgi:hypothetical protein
VKRWTLSGILAVLALSAHAQLREAWQYRFPEQGSGQVAELRRALKLADGGLLLLGAVETPLNAYDAFAIKLRPDGTPEWTLVQDGALLDDAFVDAVEVSGFGYQHLYLLGQFMNADGYLRARLYRVDAGGQVQQMLEMPADAPNLHYRAVGLVWDEQDEAVGVATERISTGESEAQLFTVYADSGTLHPVSQRVNQRPWGVARFANPFSGLVLGTRGTFTGWVDAHIYKWVGAPELFSGAVRGFDVPVIGYTVPGRGAVVGIHSFGGTTGDDIVLLFYNPNGSREWAYRYTSAYYDDYLLSMAHDAQNRLYALTTSVLWANDRLEQVSMRLLRFSPNGTLEQDMVVPTGHTSSRGLSLRGVLGINAAGQPIVAYAHPPFLTRLTRAGSVLWGMRLPMEPQALFVEPQGALLVAGSAFPEDPHAEARYLLVVKYTPSADLNGDGVVDDADLLQVLLEFGTEGETVADLNGDGVVDDADLIAVLFQFGS